MEKKEQKDIFEIVWKSLASVKLAIFILIILALSSIIGTIVEQQAEPAKNIALLAKFFGDAAAPTVYNIFARLGFMDMYGSWWFVSFLVLFSINLIVCSLERLPKTWRFIHSPQRPLSDSALKSLPIRKELRFKAGVTAAREEVLNALKASRYKVNESAEGETIHLYTQKGKFGRLGAYVVHISIIMIFLGAIIGARYGFRGFLNLPEGQTSTVAYTREGQTIPLGFTVKCNWYDTQYYEGGDTPMEFQSELVVIDNGKEVLKKEIEVNDPLKYKGITFYQSSYGMMKNAIGHFIITTTPKGGQPETQWYRLGDSFEIPGTNVRGTIVDFSPALARDRHSGQLTTYAENMVNPAIAVEFDMPGKNRFTGWILRRYPETGKLPGGHSVTFNDYWGVEYTGLQVAKDPGVWLIYLASIIMAAGLYVGFFISHRKIWVNVTPEGGGKKNSVHLALGSTSNRNRLAFEKEIDRLCSHISEAIEGRSKK